VSKNILLIEDNASIQLLLKDFFEEEGYTVACASNGLEALNVLNSSESPPRVILLDLMMPVMDGYVFREQQMKDKRFSSIPVLVMTANNQIDEKVRRIGADGYIKKPVIDIDTLLELVSCFCDSSPQHIAATQLEAQR
jgi:CheY-like chemotaxis protein